MKTYSLDLREKIVALYDAGGSSQRQLAARFCVLYFLSKSFSVSVKILEALLQKSVAAGKNLV
ncbi:MAG: hypothetical protein M3209_17505 [Acidobacteriota bacterium]|nr:hypothetical protein [Acidobacteriota bacterium]